MIMLHFIRFGGSMMEREVFYWLRKWKLPEQRAQLLYAQIPDPKNFVIINGVILSFLVSGNCTVIQNKYTGPQNYEKGKLVISDC